MALAKVPVPLDVHAIEVWFVALEPAVIFIAPAVEQVFIAVPAIAVGSAPIVKVFVAVPSTHPEFEAVSVKITLPAAISAALGV